MPVEASTPGAGDPDACGFSKVMRFMGPLPDVRLSLTLIRERTAQHIPTEVSADSEPMTAPEIAAALDGDVRVMEIAVQMTRPHRCPICGLQHELEQESEDCCGRLSDYTPPKKHYSRERGYNTSHLTPRERDTVVAMTQGGGHPSDVCRALCIQVEPGCVRREAVFNYFYKYRKAQEERP
jgi:hypothetical protein